MADIEKCTLCGLCKANCPIYKVLLEEKYSPRGKAMLIKKEILSDIFYDCTLCGACEVECPVDIDIDMRKIRNKLVEKGMETSVNKKMIENVRKYGNPFGKIEKGKIPKELYCC